MCNSHEGKVTELLLLCCCCCCFLSQFGENKTRVFNMLLDIYKELLGKGGVVFLIFLTLNLKNETKSGGGKICFLLSFL